MNGLITTNDELLHYGTKRHSGRYPFGSGERPFQSDPQKRAARKEKIREFGQKAKRIAVPVAKAAGRTALHVGISALTTTSINALTLRALADAGQEFINKSPDLMYSFFSTKAGDSLLKAANRYTHRAVPNNENLIVSRQMRILAADAGADYLRDWDRRYNKYK